MSDFKKIVEDTQNVLSEIAKPDREFLAASKRRSAMNSLTELALSEAKTKHPVPGLDDWNMYAGGTVGRQGTHTYDFHLDDGKEGLPASHTVYTIQNPSTRERGYTVWAWSPPAGHTHRMLGRVQHPQQGVTLARKHYDDHFGTKNESADADAYGRKMAQSVLNATVESQRQKKEAAALYDAVKNDDVLNTHLGGLKKVESRIVSNRWPVHSVIGKNGNRLNYRINDNGRHTAVAVSADGKVGAPFRADDMVSALHGSVTRNESSNDDTIGEETSAEKRYGTKLRIFDNGGKTRDRYTIAPPRHAKEYKERDGMTSVIASDEHPFHPQGFGQHTTAMIGPHLGKRIHWKDLAPGAKKFARQEYPDYAPKEDMGESIDEAHPDHKLIFADGHAWLAFRNAGERDKEWDRLTKERSDYAAAKKEEPLSIKKAHLARGKHSHPYLVSLAEGELSEGQKFDYHGIKQGDRVEFSSYGTKKKGTVSRHGEHTGLLFVKADDTGREHFVFPRDLKRIKEDKEEVLTEMTIAQHKARIEGSEKELKTAIAKHPGLHAIFGDDPDIDTEEAENRPIMHHVQDHHGNISLIHSTDHEGRHRAYMMWRDPDGRGHTSSVVHVTPTLDNTLANVHDEYSRRQKAADGQVRAYVGKNILGALRGLQHESEQLKEVSDELVRLYRKKAGTSLKNAEQDRLVSLHQYLNNKATHPEDADQDKRRVQSAVDIGDKRMRGIELADRRDERKDKLREKKVDEAESLDELSPYALANYIRRASTDASFASYMGGRYDGNALGERGFSQSAKRKRGISKAAFSLAARVKETPKPKIETRESMGEADLNELSKHTLDELHPETAVRYMHKAIRSMIRANDDSKFERRSKGISRASKILRGGKPVKTDEDVADTQTIDEASRKDDMEDHPRMKAYREACKARDEAHLASIRYRMNHDIKQPEHRAKYDELEAEHHRLRDIEDQASEKVNGRLFAHHVLKK